jgi:hypothetical protein
VFTGGAVPGHVHVAGSASLRAAFTPIGSIPGSAGATCTQQPLLLRPHCACMQAAAVHAERPGGVHG